MWLAPVLFGDMPCIAEIAGVACTIGHIYPVVMRFKGGKGLACLGGILLAIDWRLLLILLAIEIVIVLLVNYICIVPITASIAMPILYGVFGDLGLGWLKRAEGGWPAIWILCIVTVVMLLKHVQNLYRIATGTEMHFSYLWTKDKAGERARIESNREKLRLKKLANQQKKGEQE
jgi:glycerol-3-phosphate acyltransferase PlsY